MQVLANDIGGRIKSWIILAHPATIDALLTKQFERGHPIASVE